MNIQWYPGHMAKATRLIKEDLKNVDIVVKLLDSRAVIRSENNDFNKILNQKKFIRVYNKCDLADENETMKWQNYFKEKGEDVFFIDSMSKKGINEVLSYLNNIKSTFRANREVRAMVVGIPNVGKSMFINSITKKSNAKTGNRPGVTLSKQWIKVKGEVYLLDTPGVLPPKFENLEDGVCLASIGSVKDTILDREELCLKLIEFLIERYPDKLKERYKLESVEKMPIEVYEDIGRKRGFLLKGGEIDYLRTAVTVLDEFKNGLIGRISFDRVCDL
ncbi:ribosome biogenesis GTPase YlqF [Anaerofustis sp. NSJ-163]|uniref:ribosome biogenesis GTPase YlqF n=1 Tax=Anaerofustis sp. NSJ-163 TaxID=2944391 RepID=UPI00209C15B6|nr:ribosome biogenesis GTPase YlqF [Anaerofustis sp. NSJ-163]MCO8193288.1 ribosome biogenesis GTPase YlqF [Anaerofustis sp. NSJ-163]